MIRLVDNPRECNAKEKYKLMAVYTIYTFGLYCVVHELCGPATCCCPLQWRTLVFSDLFLACEGLEIGSVWQFGRPSWYVLMLILDSCFLFILVYSSLLTMPQWEVYTERCMMSCSGHAWFVLIATSIPVEVAIIIVFQEIPQYEHAWVTRHNYCAC